MFSHFRAMAFIKNVWIPYYFCFLMFYLKEYYIAIDYFEKSLSHIKESEKNAFTEDIGHITLNLFYCYKNVGKKYNKQKILNYIKNESEISWYDNYLISQLLEDNS